MLRGSDLTGASPVESDHAPTARVPPALPALISLLLVIYQLLVNHLLVQCAARRDLTVGAWSSKKGKRLNPPPLKVACFPVNGQRNPFIEQLTLWIQANIYQNCLDCPGIP